MKNIIVVTGGAGFVGSNLIKTFLQKTKKKIISIDNYSTGSKRNEIKNSRVKYINGSTSNIDFILKNYKNNLDTIFHFGEFSRIYQSFKDFDKCFKYNIIGSKEVFLFCLKNNVRLIYSATSASLGNNGKDKNLSPYAFTKAKNLELLENLKKWFKLNFDIIYFYNVYGPKQISTGYMATVIGIFEYQKKNNLPLTVVKPGTQKRRFTHIGDTIEVCFNAWKKNKHKHYSISNQKSYSIIEVAKMFKSKIVYLPTRSGERYASKLTKMNLSNQVIQKFGKIDLKNYINGFIKNL